MVSKPNSAGADRPSCPLAVSTRRVFAALLALSFCPLVLPAQNTQPPAQYSVHGIVRDTSSGQPLPRALVLANGESGVGALTDGDGRFTLDGLSAGPNSFEVSKPGYEDATGASDALPLRDLRGYTHTVFVTADTPELDFGLRPTNAIHGHVELSTGDTAQGINITLLQQQIVNGRAIWRPGTTTHVGADGNYRFGHLSDGDYVLRAEPATETGDVTLPDPSSNRTSIPGFPQTYYPDATTFTGAARVHVSGGEQAQADFTLALATFHLVRARALLPPAFRNESAQPIIQVEVTTADGAEAPYPSNYDRKGAMVRAMLPDGTYTITINVLQRIRSGPVMQQHPLTGSVGFTVSAHPLTNLRIPMGMQPSNPLVVMVSRTSAHPSANKAYIHVGVSQAGPLTDGMAGTLAMGESPGTLEATAPSPGRYWVTTAIADPSLCEASFSAGGASLAREPLVVNSGGITAPLTLNLRDGCASLRIGLPPAAAAMTAGREPAYTVYLVPDFDFTGEVHSITVRPSGGGSYQFNGLTPGSYHVYTFPAPVELEYRNPKVLASLNGQQITLDPDAAADLTLEVPAQ